MENGKSITVNEAMSWKATLLSRHAELVGLRNSNAARHTTYHGANADKPMTTELKYDAVSLDKQITKLATELRKLDLAIKNSNFYTPLNSYVYDEAILGELQPAAK